MDKSYFVYILVLVVGMNFLINFIEDINENDSSMLSKEEREIKKDKLYYKTDSIGDLILVLPEDMKISKKKEIFKRSFIYKEIVEEFPMFNEMVSIAEEKISDNKLKESFIKKIREIEDKYLSGELSQIEVKKQLYNY